MLCPDVNINVVNEKGQTVLYLASLMRHSKVIEVLLTNKKINVNDVKKVFIQKFSEKFNAITEF